MSKTQASSPNDEPQATSQGSPKADETAKTTGRGFLIITAAKLYFMVTGAAVQLGLPILFGSPEQFGVFKIVTEAISLVNMVMITGTLQAVSKLVSEEPARAREVVNQALKLQCLLGLPIAAIYALLSPFIAGSLFNDAELTGLMQLSSLIILFYSFYAIFVGYLNGVKSFVRQATLDITFQTIKTVAILGLVVVGAGVTGAVGGFAAAAGVIFVISAVWTLKVMRADHPKTKEVVDDAQELASRKERLRRLGIFLLLVMLYTGALNGLMRVDLFMIKSISSAPPESLSALAPIFKDISDKFAGIYGAALNIARLPFQGVIAVTFVIFPLISESTFSQDKDRTRAYIQDTFRYCLLLIGAVALPLIFNSDSVIAGLYSADYQAAGEALAIMNIGIIFFAMLYVAMTIIIGAGKPIVACVIMGISLAICGGANWVVLQMTHDQTLQTLVWAPLTGVVPATDAAGLVQQAIDQSRHQLKFAAPYLLRGPDYMKAAAVATSISMFSGCMMALAWLWRTFDAKPPLATIVRLLIGAGVLFGVDIIFPSPVVWVSEKGKLVYLAIVAVKMIVMGLALLASLALTREFGDKDLERVKAVIGRKKKKAST